MLLCAEYVLPITREPIESGAVLVRDGKIADIGPAEQLRVRYANEEVRTFNQAALMPGIVDVYSRVEHSVIRGMVADLPFAEWLQRVTQLSRSLNASSLYDSALLGGLEMLSAGITCVGAITQNDSTVRALGDLGIRATVFREVGAMDARRIDFAMRQAADDIEKWQGNVKGSLVRIGIAPSSLYHCHPAVFGKAAQYAGNDIPVAIRVAGSREEFEFVKYGRSKLSVDIMQERGYVEVPPWLPTGVTPVNYVLNWGGFDAKNTMAVHAIHVDDNDIQALRSDDVAIAHCPRCNGMLGMGVAPVSEYLKAGMRIGIGTDSPAATDTTDIFAELRTSLELQRATDPQDFLTSDTMLEMATIGGARVMGMEDTIGSLEVGKQADIIAVDLSGSHATPTKNPIAAVVNTATASDVTMTMVGGNVLYEQGKWTLSADFARSISNVLQVRSSLRSLND